MSKRNIKKVDLASLEKQRIPNFPAEYLKTLKKKPNDTSTRCQLGILYGENGLLTEIIKRCCVLSVSITTGACSPRCF